ncbi:MAG: M2 family metallopeptidase [Acidobacteriota bacterium]
MRNKKLLLLALASCACPPEKKPEPTPPKVVETKPPPAPEPPKPPEPTPQQKLAAEAKQFVADAQAPLRQLLVDASVASWTNETDITKEHEDGAAKANEALSVGMTKMVKDARKFEAAADLLDPDTRRQLYIMKTEAPPSPDDPAKATELAKLGTEMDSLYGKGVCKPDPKDKTKQKCTIVDDYSKVLETSKNPRQLLEAWKTWHDTIGHEERDDFVKFVALANEGARGIGFKDISDQWKSGYDMPPEAFEADVDRVWGQVKPLYDQLHCYARRQLNKKYGDKVVPKTGPIPSQVLGNMWAQSWDYVYPELEPYKGVAAIDVTPTLQKKYPAKPDPLKSAKEMVKIGENFYTSIGFDPLPPTFWERSQFIKPPDKVVVCHASAWDVTFSDDLRIKMCIQPKQEDLWTIHHELGHDFYFQHYYTLPILYQNGANDGFHEAIGDTIQLSMTPDYLKQIGLLDKVVKNDKATINAQMKVALTKIAFLPFGLMVDKWRWDVFSGKVTPDQYNQHWWDLKLKYQGVVPPVPRSATDFDPGAKYHVAANVPYMRYFLAAVYQFQFQRALCKKAGFTGPLHECSIFGNKAAGDAYGKMLALGASRPWQDALFELTGERDLDASAILEYFAPLQKWLEEQNKGQQCGW